MKKLFLTLASTVVLGLWGTALQAQQVVVAGPGAAACVGGVACAPAAQQVVTAVAQQPMVVPVTAQVVVANLF